MAKSLFANVQGSVFKVDHREGIGKKSNLPYSMDILTVLVPGAGLSELVLPNDGGNISADALAALVGHDVDFLVEVFPNEFGYGVKVIEDRGNVVREVASLVASAAA